MDINLVKLRQKAVYGVKGEMPSRSFCCNPMPSDMEQQTYPRRKAREIEKAER